MRPARWRWQSVLMRNDERSAAHELVPFGLASCVTARSHAVPRHRLVARRVGTLTRLRVGSSTPGSAPCCGRRRRRPGTPGNPMHECCGCAALPGLATTVCRRAAFSAADFSMLPGAGHQCLSFAEGWAVASPAGARGSIFGKSPFVHPARRPVPKCGRRNGTVVRYAAASTFSDPRAPALPPAKRPARRYFGIFGLPADERC